MFKFFKNKPPKCPIDRETRIWMEGAFLWLVKQFSEETILNKTILIPNTTNFPISYDGSVESLKLTSAIVANQMEININSIDLKLYDDNIREVNRGMGVGIFTEVDKENGESLSAGFYGGKNSDSRYEIYIERSLLLDPENLVATLAHEFSHIKLLGENRIETNYEDLTDLTTVFFGLGIFNANACFKQKQDFSGWSHKSLGYLKQQEWGYALALYAYFREEKVFDWINYLSPNIRSDFKKSMEYIHSNTDKVFIEE